MTSSRLSRFFHKTLAASLALAMAAESGLLHAAESNVWAERRRAAARLSSPGADLVASLPAGLSDALAAGPARVVSFPEQALTADPALQSKLSRLPEALRRIPTSLGEVTDVRLSPRGGAPVVVLIQDAHQVLSAQRNIDGLLSRVAPDFIGIEGSAGGFLIPLYRRLPDQDLQKDVADALFDKNLLTGAEHYGLTADKDSFFWGLETPALYMENVDAYRRGLDVGPEADGAVQRIQQRLDVLKESAFSPALKDFDRLVSGYDRHEVPLTAYAEALKGFLPPPLWGRAGVGGAFPETAKFLDALAQEKALDFKAVESERAQLVSLLSRSLDKAALEALVPASLAYRAGQAGHGAYYGYLKDVMARAGVAPGRFKAFDAYVRYALAADGVKPSLLFDELEAMKGRAALLLARTPAERDVFRRQEDLRLVRGLLAHELTADQWRLYQVRRNDKSSPLLSGETQGEGDLLSLVAPFEGFYRAASKRDAALSANFLSKLSERKADTAALIAGGFHAAGLRDLLAVGGVTVVTVTPRIQDVPDNPAAYLDVFGPNRTPLEKMLLGDKLTTNPESATARDHMLPYTAAAEAVLMRPLNAADDRSASMLGVRARFHREGEVIVEEAVEPGAAASFTVVRAPIGAPGRGIPESDDASGGTPGTESLELRRTRSRAVVRPSTPSFSRRAALAWNEGVHGVRGIVSTTVAALGWPSLRDAAFEAASTVHRGFELAASLTDPVDLAIAGARATGVDPLFSLVYMAKGAEGRRSDAVSKPGGAPGARRRTPSEPPGKFRRRGLLSAASILVMGLIYELFPGEERAPEEPRRPAPEPKPLPADAGAPVKRPSRLPAVRPFFSTTRYIASVVDKWTKSSDPGERELAPILRKLMENQVPDPTPGLLASVKPPMFGRAGAAPEYWLDKDGSPQVLFQVGPVFGGFLSLREQNPRWSVRIGDFLESFLFEQASLARDIFARRDSKGQPYMGRLETSLLAALQKGVAPYLADGRLAITPDQRRLDWHLAEIYKTFVALHSMTRARASLKAIDHWRRHSPADPWAVVDEITPDKPGVSVFLSLYIQGWKKDVESDGKGATPGEAPSLRLRRAAMKVVYQQVAKPGPVIQQDLLGMAYTLAAGAERDAGRDGKRGKSETDAPFHTVFDEASGSYLPPRGYMPYFGEKRYADPTLEGLEKTFGPNLGTPSGPVWPGVPVFPYGTPTAFLIGLGLAAAAHAWLGGGTGLDAFSHHRGGGDSLAAMAFWPLGGWAKLFERLRGPRDYFEKRLSLARAGRNRLAAAVFSLVLMVIACGRTELEVPPYDAPGAAGAPSAGMAGASGFAGGGAGAGFGGVAGMAGQGVGGAAGAQAGAAGASCLLDGRPATAISPPVEAGGRIVFPRNDGEEHALTAADTNGVHAAQYNFGQEVQDSAVSPDGLAYYVIADNQVTVIDSESGERELVQGPWSAAGAAHAALTHVAARGPLLVVSYETVEDGAAWAHFMPYDISIKSNAPVPGVERKATLQSPDASLRVFITLSGLGGQLTAFCDLGDRWAIFPPGVQDAKFTESRPETGIRPAGMTGAVWENAPLYTSYGLIAGDGADGRPYLMSVLFSDADHPQSKVIGLGDAAGRAVSIAALRLEDTGEYRAFVGGEGVVWTARAVFQDAEGNLDGLEYRGALPVVFNGNPVSVRGLQLGAKDSVLEGWGDYADQATGATGSVYFTIQGCTSWDFGKDARVSSITRLVSWNSLPDISQPSSPGGQKAPGAAGGSEMGAAGAAGILALLPELLRRLSDARRNSKRTKKLEREIADALKDPALAEDQKRWVQQALDDGDPTALRKAAGDLVRRTVVSWNEEGTMNLPGDTARPDNARVLGSRVGRTAARGRSLASRLDADIGVMDLRDRYVAQIFKESSQEDQKRIMALLTGPLADTDLMGFTGEGLARAFKALGALEEGDRKVGGVAPMASARLRRWVQALGFDAGRDVEDWVTRVAPKWETSFVVVVAGLTFLVFRGAAAAYFPRSLATLLSAGLLNSFAILLSFVVANAAFAVVLHPEVYKKNAEGELVPDEATWGDWRHIFWRAQMGIHAELLLSGLAAYWLIPGGLPHGHIPAALFLVRWAAVGLAVWYGIMSARDRHTAYNRLAAGGKELTADDLMNLGWLMGFHALSSPFALLWWASILRLDSDGLPSDRERILSEWREKTSVIASHLGVQFPFASGALSEPSAREDALVPPSRRLMDPALDAPVLSAQTLLDNLVQVHNRLRVPVRDVELTQAQARWAEWALFKRPATVGLMTDEQFAVLVSALRREPGLLARALGDLSRLAGGRQDFKEQLRPLQAALAWVLAGAPAEPGAVLKTFDWVQAVVEETQSLSPVPREEALMIRGPKYVDLRGAERDVAALSRLVELCRGEDTVYLVVEDDWDAVLKDVRRDHPELADALAGARLKRLKIAGDLVADPVKMIRRMEDVPDADAIARGLKAVLTVNPRLLDITSLKRLFSDDLEEVVRVLIQTLNATLEVRKGGLQSIVGNDMKGRRMAGEAA